MTDPLFTHLYGSAPEDAASAMKRSTAITTQDVDAPIFIPNVYAMDFNPMEYGFYKNPNPVDTGSEILLDGGVMLCNGVMDGVTVFVREPIVLEVDGPLTIRNCEFAWDMPGVPFLGCTWLTIRDNGHPVRINDITIRPIYHGEGRAKLGETK